MSFLLLILLSLLVSRTISEQAIQWNSDMTTRIARPLIREFSEPWTSHAIKNQFYHYKTHFDIIIKQGTKFTLTVEASSTIEMLYFYCLTESPSGTFNMLNLAGETNSTRTLTANFHCVPMISVSHNIPVVLTIESKDWMPLPIFDSNHATLATSQKIESEFYEKVKIFGFIENYNTQMLLSANDISNIKLSGYSLYLGLQNQIDVVEYYDYLTATKNGHFAASLDRSTLFIRSERCYDDYVKYYSQETLALISQNSCGNGDTSCNFVHFTGSSSCPDTYFDPHWISVIGEIENFLEPTKGSSWILLEKFAHYYNREEIVDGLGETLDLWNDIFAILYQQKFRIANHLTPTAYPYPFNAVANYRKGFPFTEWSHEEKLNLFLSLFGYDGTDTPLREFRLRYSPFVTHSTNMISTLLETFLDIYVINLLPFLQQVIRFKKYVIPLLNPDLELRLLSGHSVMPAVDFQVNPAQLQTRSKERDLREFSPLMLLPKVKKLYLEVKFAIVSPIDLADRCLYLNNECHKIVEHVMKVKLLADVYSTYVVEEIDGNLYFSDVTYHTISKNMLIKIKVNKIQQNKPFLPLVHYRFDAKGISDAVFLQMFINYKDMTLGIRQLTDQIHEYFNDDLYFSLSLERNGSLIFKYEFFGLSQNQQALINVVHKFRVHDKLNIYHREPHRLQMNVAGYSNESPANIFVFTNVGLHNAADNMNFKIISADVQRIDEFVRTYSVDVSDNALFRFYLARYIRALRSNNFDGHIPEYWSLDSN